MADARDRLGAIALDGLTAPAPVAALAPAQIARHRVEVDDEAGRDAFENRDERPAVRLASGQKSQHSPFILYEVPSPSRTPAPRSRAFRGGRDLAPCARVLFADRFMVLEEPGRAIDLASARPVWIVRRPAGAVREQIAWSEACDAALGGPGPSTLVDYGTDGRGGVFEAWSGPPPGPMPRAPGWSDAARVDRLIARLFDPAEHEAAAAARIVAVQGASPGARGAALIRAARLARLGGFVPMALELADTGGSTPVVEAVLRERSLCLLAESFAGQSDRPRFQRLWAALVTQALRSPRPRVAIGAAQADVDGVDRILLRPRAAARGQDTACRDRAVRAAEQRATYGLGELSGPPPVHRWARIDPSADAHVREQIATAQALLAAGRRAAGERRLRQAIGAAERRGLREPAVTGALALASALVGRGRPRDALTVLEPAARLPGGASLDGGPLALAAMSARARIDLGRLDEAEELLRTAAAAPVPGDDAGARAVRVELARCLWWRGGFAEAADLLDGDASRERAGGEEWTDARALALRARAAASVGRLDLAHGCASRARGSAARGARALGAAAAAWVHLAAGDTEAARAAAGAALSAAVEDRLPMLAVTARVLLAEAHRRDGEPAAASLALRVPIRLLPCLPPLLRAKIKLMRDLVAGQAAVKTIVERHITGTGLAGLVWLVPAAARGLAASGGGTSGLAPCLVDILQACQAAGDEAAVLREACGRLRRDVRAAGVAVFVPAASEPAVIASDGAGVPSEAAGRAIAAGVAVAPAVRQGPGVEAAPILYAGDVIGAVGVVWPLGAAPVRSAPLAALGPVAAALAPVVASMRASRRAAAGAGPDALIGTSDALQRVRDAVAQAAPAPFPVLVEGESGSGKELVARALHSRGPRRDRAFVSINCAALPEDLVESELFGHARGAFTGAAGERAGVFEDAHGGTLFLDEIAELSPRAQAKLLRVVQDGEVRRLGESALRRVDARVVAATNRDLRRDVEAGRFRADLLYRLDVVRIRVPPLRDRREDVPPLVEAYWREATGRVGSRAVLAAGTMAALTRYHWPGNVRELQNVLAALAVRCAKRGVVPPTALPPDVSEAPGEPLRLDQARRAFEERFVRGALARAGGHHTRAASELGVSRQGLTKLMKRLGIQTRA